MPKDKTKISKDLLYQERLDRLGIIALNVIESLITDTETSIEGRLHAAFRLLEVYGSDKMEVGITKAISEGLQQNGEIIENNAKLLAEIASFCNSFKKN
jgi:hypothetical protein